jgi:hypothetical protein
MAPETGLQQHDLIVIGSGSERFIPWHREQDLLERVQSPRGSIYRMVLHFVTSAIRP